VKTPTAGPKGHLRSVDDDQGRGEVSSRPTSHIQSRFQMQWAATWACSSSIRRAWRPIAAREIVPDDAYRVRPTTTPVFQKYVTDTTCCRNSTATGFRSARHPLRLRPRQPTDAHTLADIDSFLTEVLDKKAPTALHRRRPSAGAPVRLPHAAAPGPAGRRSFVQQASTRTAETGADRFEAKERAEFAYTFAARGQFRVNVIAPVERPWRRFLWSLESVHAGELKIPDRAPDVPRPTTEPL